MNATPDGLGADAPVIAVFDFDGTISYRDQLVAFLFRVGPTSRVLASFARHAVPSLREGASNGRNALKAAVFRDVFRGRPGEEIRRVGRAFAKEILPRLRPEMVEQIRWHAERGDRIVIVSASMHAYLDPLAEELGADEVVAVDLEEDANGVCTGRLLRPNVRGPEKAVRLQELLDGQNAEIWAYGDSDADAHVLAMATRAFPLTGRLTQRLDELRREN